MQAKAKFNANLKKLMEEVPVFGFGPYPSEEDRENEFKINERVLLTRQEVQNFEKYEECIDHTTKEIVTQETTVRDKIETEKREAEALRKKKHEELLEKIRISNIKKVPRTYGI